MDKSGKKPTKNSVHEEHVVYVWYKHQVPKVKKKTNASTEKS